MSVGAVRDFFLPFCHLLVKNWSLYLAFLGKRYNIVIVPDYLSLFSLVGLFCGTWSRKMDGWLSLALRCIVVKATQVFESSLVAELVLVLGDRQKHKLRTKIFPCQNKHELDVRGLWYPSIYPGNYSFTLTLTLYFYWSFGSSLLKVLILLSWDYSLKDFSPCVYYVRQFFFCCCCYYSLSCFCHLHPLFWMNAFTSVCTMAGLCVRSILTVWKMSTAPS